MKGKEINPHISELTLNVITQEFTTDSIKAVRLADRINEWHQAKTKHLTEQLAEAEGRAKLNYNTACKFEEQLAAEKLEKNQISDWFEDKLAAKYKELSEVKTQIETYQLRARANYGFID